MKTDVDKMIEKFEIKLKNYEIDKVFGQITPDSIYSLWPNEMETLIEYIHYLEEDSRRLRQELTILSIRPEFNSHQPDEVYDRKEITSVKESGIYFRACKDGKWQAVLLEQLPGEYIDEFLEKYDTKQLIVCIKQLARALKCYQDNDENFKD